MTVKFKSKDVSLRDCSAQLASANILLQVVTKDVIYTSNFVFKILFAQSQLTLGWFIAICMLYQSIVSPAKMGDRSYIYNRVDAANYAAFAPITWCLFFGWIIFTSHTGNGGRKLNQNRLKSNAFNNV